MLRKTLTACLLCFAMQSNAAEVSVVVSFSILEDLARNVGGDRIEVTSIVGRNRDVHGFIPTPGDAKTIRNADIVFINGLGFEGWLDRMIRLDESSNSKIIDLSSNLPEAIQSVDHENEEMHDEHHGHGHEHAGKDPHVWHSVSNMQIYVTGMKEALCNIDPDGCTHYQDRTRNYAERLEKLDQHIRSQIAKIPKDRRKAIVPHSAFGHFERDYGIEFISISGIDGTEQPSAQKMAEIIEKIRKHDVSSIFVETISDSRIMEQISRETDVKLAGALYADTLGEEDDATGTYIGIMLHNTNKLSESLREEFE